MTRAQRVVLIVGLTLTALALHFALCSYGFPEPTSGRNPPSGVRILPGLMGHWGLNFFSTVIFGVAIPLLLLTAAAYVTAGWRQSARQECGLCLRCGYDLKFNYEAGCPECGWRRG